MNVRIPERRATTFFLSSLAAATSPLYLNLLFSFFFFPLPSLSRKRDKHERAGIDLFEALHEHQQRSRNKRVEDPPKRASPSRYRLSLLPTRSSPNLSVFSDPWLFSKEPPVYVGGPRFSTLPSCHFAYIQTHAIHRPLFVPFSFQYSFFPLSPFSSNNNSFSYYSFESATSNSRSFSREWLNFLNLVCFKTKNRSFSTIPCYELCPLKFQRRSKVFRSAVGTRVYALNEKPTVDSFVGCFRFRFVSIISRVADVETNRSLACSTVM